MWNDDIDDLANFFFRIGGLEKLQEERILIFKMWTVTRFFPSNF